MLRLKVLRRRTVLVLTFLTIPTLASCFVVYGSLISGTESNSEPANSKIVPTLASGSVTTKFEVEVITVRTDSFEPVEIVRPKGPFVLLVDDRSGKENLSLSLQRLQGEKLRDINTRRTKSEWHDVINLPPGNYLLTDAGNPDALCQITITP